MFLLIENLFKEGWFIAVLVISAVVFIALIIFVSFVLTRRRMRHQVRDLEYKYNNIHDTFSIDCSNMIKRIEVISQHNKDYEQIYISSQERFSNILNSNDKCCYCAVDSLKKLIDEKDYKELPSIIESTRTSMDEFDKESKLLNSDLQSIMKKEEDCRSKIVPLKEKFRNLKEWYEKNSTALLSLSKSFNFLFNHISSLFSTFEDLLTEAKYNEALKSIPEIEKLLNATNLVTNDIPYLNALTDKVIPEKIKELSDTYLAMEKENYPLHNLLVKSKIEKMNEIVKDCKNKLNTLSITGVGDKLNSISLEISKIFTLFDKEKEAKKAFDKEQDSISNSTYEAEKQYANLNRSLPTYSKAYVINQTYIDQMRVIKDMIDDMSTKKRMLDMYLNSSTKQPYTILLKNLRDLQDKISKIQKAFDDFHDYLLGLKRDCEKSFNYVRSAYVQLRKSEYNVRKVDVQALSDVMAPRIEMAINKLSNLDNSLRVTPIDVNKLNYNYNEAVEYINNLNKDIAECVDFSTKAEDAIVYDNNIRRKATEVSQQLEVAEKSFLEADFTRSYNQAIQIYKKWGNEETK